MSLRVLRRVGGWLSLSLVGMGLVTKTAQAAVQWFPLGPYGGDARSIVADPHDSQHLFLGTATGWVFTSQDGGKIWSRLAQINKRNDLVIDHITVDPRSSLKMVAGAFLIDHPDGGIFLSNDGGKTWYPQAEMRGQSVRSLARSASDPDKLVAGTLKGVFCSEDNGLHWHLISPLGGAEIREVQSVAIDPSKPDVIYAGTWHLPWKTLDGGKNWIPITQKNGLIDDSDVFSIIVDPVQSDIVYASACSGIYKSVNSGGHFEKVPTSIIPSSARRTRRLMQDPSHLDTVFAGTTEGLYRTIDAGAHWSLETDPGVVINDVYVDPKDANHVLIATDRGGVLSSIDGGVSFEPSNSGFSARQVTSYIADPHNRASLFVGVVNDKATGGVFQSTDGGLHWKQQSSGLGGRDIFSLSAAPDGTLLAGTAHGLFRYENGEWADSSTMKGSDPVEKAAPVQKTTSARHGTGVKPARVTPVKPDSAPSRRLDTVVYTMHAGDDEMFAGTELGLVRGDASGSTWWQVTSLDMPDTRFIGVQKKMVLTGSLKRMMLSMDDGKTWDVVALPGELTQIAGLAVDEMNNLWVGGPEGVYVSTDLGANWKTPPNLFVTRINGIYFDAPGHRVLVTSSNTTFAFAAHLPDYKVSYWDTGWNLRFIRPVGDHLIGATYFDGMVLQPKMVDSSFADEKTTAQK